MERVAVSGGVLFVGCRRGMDGRLLCVLSVSQYARRCAVSEATVKCDEVGCDWLAVIADENIPKWHRKPCPKCGKGYIVNDVDLVSFRLITALEAVSKEIDPEGKSLRNVRLDTSALRAVRDE